MTAASEDTRFAVASEDDGTRQAVMAMTEAIKLVMASFIATDDDPRHGIALSITAASMFAGAQWGSLLHLGQVTQQDTRRGTEMVARNFREGIKVGLAHAKRIEIEQFGAGQS